VHFVYKLPNSMLSVELLHAIFVGIDELKQFTTEFVILEFQDLNVFFEGSLFLLKIAH
jgi:hypothetical protein